MLKWVRVVTLATLLKFLLAINICAGDSAGPEWCACHWTTAGRLLRLVVLQVVLPGILLLQREKQHRLKFVAEKRDVPEGHCHTKTRAGPSQLLKRAIK